MSVLLHACQYCWLQSPNLHLQSISGGQRVCMAETAPCRGFLVVSAVAQAISHWLSLCAYLSLVSAQDGIVTLGKAHTRSAPSLTSLPKVAIETVAIFVWLNTDRSRPQRVECRPLPFSTPLSFRRSMQ